MKPGNLSEEFLSKAVVRFGEQIFSAASKKICRYTLCISNLFL